MFDAEFSGRRRKNVTERFGGLTSAAATMIKVEDPFPDLDEVVEAYDEITPEGRVANSWLRRHKRRLGFTEDRKLALEGCVGCVELGRAIDRQISRIRLPSEHECPECGTKWRVEMQVREERRHVW